MSMLAQAAPLTMHQEEKTMMSFRRDSSVTGHVSRWSVVGMILISLVTVQKASAQGAPVITWSDSDSNEEPEATYYVPPAPDACAPALDEGSVEVPGLGEVSYDECTEAKSADYTPTYVPSLEEMERRRKQEQFERWRANQERRYQKHQELVDKFRSQQSDANRRYEKANSAYRQSRNSFNEAATNFGPSNAAPPPLWGDELASRQSSSDQSGRRDERHTNSSSERRKRNSESASQQESTDELKNRLRKKSDNELRDYYERTAAGNHAVQEGRELIEEASEKGRRDAQLGHYGTGAAQMAKGTADMTISTLGEVSGPMGDAIDKGYSAANDVLEATQADDMGDWAAFGAEKGVDAAIKSLGPAGKPLSTFKSVHGGVNSIGDGIGNIRKGNEAISNLDRRTERQLADNDAQLDRTARKAVMTEQVLEERDLEYDREYLHTPPGTEYARGADELDASLRYETETSDERHSLYEPFNQMYQMVEPSIVDSTRTNGKPEEK